MMDDESQLPSLKTEEDEDHLTKHLQPLSKGAWKKPFFLIGQITLMTVFCLPYFTFYLIQVQPEYDSYLSKPLVKYSLFGLNLLTVGSSWGMLGVYLLKSHQRILSDGKIWFQFMQTVSLLSLTLLISLTLVFQTLSGACPADVHYPYDFHCNPFHNIPLFPVDTATFSGLIPLIFIVIMKEKRIYLTMSMFTISFCAIVFCSVYLHALKVLMMIIPYTISTIIIGGDSFLLVRLVRKLMKKLNDSLEEKQRLLDKQKMAEMKDVIANVAHDLKTVRFFPFFGVFFVLFCFLCLLFVVFLYLSPLPLLLAAIFFYDWC
jgi:hypothetical protein